MSSNNRNNSQQTNSVDEVVLQGILSVVNSPDSTWIGTMTNLTNSLTRVIDKSQRAQLPGSPSALRLVINRVANRIRTRGISVRFGRTTDHKRTRFVRFAR
jgi:hypothetical protein